MKSAYGVGTDTGRFVRTSIDCRSPCCFSTILTIEFMTTLVALASKDALVMGTDSLATVTRPLVDPLDLSEFFDADNEFSIKLDDQGKPLLDSLLTIMEQAQSVPYNQLGNVLKLFDLSPLPMGVMFSGITSIGYRTIGKMISEFREREKASDSNTEQSNYTVRSIGDRLREFLRQYYASIYPQEHMQSELELIIGGYNRLSHLPSLYRINVQEDTIVEIFSDESPFGVAFGGQNDWIQRIVFGTDQNNQSSFGTASTRPTYRVPSPALAKLLSTLESHLKSQAQIHGVMNSNYSITGISMD